MTRTWKLYSMALAVAAVLASPALADEWNDRTILTFSEAVMVPGATLQPGTYVFKLADSSTARHMVQVLTEDGSKMVTTTQAVPTKRIDPKSDIVIRLNPTDRGAPPAIKAWFYPNSVYGHEFVYPEEQARQIAERTKTMVLSVDVPGTDLEKGTLRTFDPSGKLAEWRGDAAVLQEWDSWRRNRPADTSATTADQDKERQATAPMVRGDFQGTRVKLDDLEANPTKYTGQTISVDAEVEEIFGPRLFTIDEPHWGDLDGEILVFMPTALAALVREDDRVTITGSVRPFVRAEVEREWGWLGLSPEVEVEFSKKPVLVASRIVGGNNDVAMVIDADPPHEGANSTGMKGATSSLTDVTAIASGNAALVGRHVELSGLRVNRMAEGGGFFVDAMGKFILVLPAHNTKATVAAGDVVSVKGVIAEAPDGMDDRLKAPKGWNDDIYIVATAVTK